jgi:hypothetical protein
VIPGTCIACLAALSVGEMHQFLDLCEKHGIDARQHGRGGIKCDRCRFRTLAEAAEDDPTGIEASLVRKIRIRVRAQILGLEVIQGGRGA